METTSNADAVMGKLERILDDFGFNTDNLGDRLVRKLAANISQRGIRDRRGYDQDFRPNKPLYREWKAAHGFKTDPNQRTGQMLSEESVVGRPDIGDTEIVWPYGTGATGPPDGSKHPQTDVQKAGYAHDSHDRPFFGLTEDDKAEALDMVGTTLAHHINGPGL